MGETRRSGSGDVTASARAARVGGHLKPSSNTVDTSLTGKGGADILNKLFNPGTLLGELDRGILYPEFRSLVWDFFSTPEGRQLLPPVEQTKDEARALSYRTIQAFGRANIKPLSAMIEDPMKYFIMSDAMALVDLSLAIKMGVQCSLWGGSIYNLGTEVHHKQYLKASDDLSLMGCFAMTELGHGSNVAMLQTKALFDKETDELIITTPDERAIKWWIGNAARDGVIATVFARLKVPGEKGEPVKDLGVHAIVVPLRDRETMAPLPGVEIRDCGYKVGLNGIDNGALKFSGIRVPRTNLLNRYGSLERDGSYHSPLPTPAKRFAATLGELVGGRVGLAYSSVSVLRGAIAIAINWSEIRRQFGPPGAEEIAILDYQSQQQRLLPILASAYAFHFARVYLGKRYSLLKKGNQSDALVSEVHSLSSGLKAHVTAYTAKSISICREACGGHGYAAINRFGQMRNDHDIYQTFEGDNTVLLQQLAAELLKSYSRRFEGSAISASFAYLRQMLKTALPQNPLVSHSTDEHHLRNPAFLLKTMKYRSARLLHSVALRLRKYKAKLSDFDAWNRCLSHLLATANAHVETVVAQKFLEGLDECQDPINRTVLLKLFELFTLQRIWNDIGTWRNDDYIAPSKAKAIQKLLGKLYIEVRVLAPSLVKGFGIPEHVLRAPIGLTSEEDLYTQYLHAVGF